MKTEVIEISGTRRNLVIEIPATVVETEIERITRDYTRAARIPGFRQGKVPPKVVRQRFRDQILHDVAHGLIPKAVDEALRERGLEPVDTPDIRDVTLEEGRPLTFTASFETVPPLDHVDYSGLVLRRPPVDIQESAVDETLDRLRDRAARYDTIENRPLEMGDTAVVDLERQTVGADEPPERHDSVSIDVGSSANPPGFDEQLTGLGVDDTKQFTVTYPAEYAIAELAGSEVQYGVTVKAIRVKVVPELDDEFAKDLGEFPTLEALRDRVREDLRRDAAESAEREVRSDLLRQLADRVQVEVPGALLDREIDRRVEEFVRRLIEQRVDPRRTSIDWEEFRERQREPARESVRAALVLDEVARREDLAVGAEEVDREIARYAERAGRTPAAVRAGLESEGGITRLYTGLRRDKAVDFLLSRAKIVAA